MSFPIWERKHNLYIYIYNMHKCIYYVLYVCIQSTYIYAYTHKYIHQYIHQYIYISIYISIYIYIHTYTYIYIHISMHTPTHLMFILVKHSKEFSLIEPSITVSILPFAVEVTLMKITFISLSFTVS
jgi:hypothetical protein